MAGTECLEEPDIVELDFALFGASPYPHICRAFRHLLLRSLTNSSYVQLPSEALPENLDDMPLFKQEEVVATIGTPDYFKSKAISCPMGTIISKKCEGRSLVVVYRAFPLCSSYPPWTFTA